MLHKLLVHFKNLSKLMKLLMHFKYMSKLMKLSNTMFFFVYSANDSPWVKIEIKITIMIVFTLIHLLVFAREAFGSVKATNFVSKNSARIENFMSLHGREVDYDNCRL